MLEGANASVDSLAQEDGGYEIRMEAYKVAWMKCLQRVRVRYISLIHNFSHQIESIGHPESAVQSCR